MQEENRRIYMKDGQEGGLTENQMKTVNRNDERISQLMEQVEVLVAQIKDKNLQREKQATLSKPNEKLEEKEDNDDIRDTTNETADQGTNWRLRKKMSKHLSYLIQRKKLTLMRIYAKKRKSLK